MAVVVGQRVSREGYFGTVRFVGELPESSGVWVGVEWDDTNRGKHGGVHNGVRYFSCKHPTSGSFVRLSKLERGISIVEALRRRYFDNEEELVSEVAGTSVGHFGKERGGEQSLNLPGLQKVVLRNESVYGEFQADAFAALQTEGIRSLDLGSNLLSSWDEVVKIASHLTKLEELDLSDDRMALPSNLSTCSSAFSSLRTVYLSRTMLTWSEVLTLGSMMNALEEVHVCQNDMRHLRCDEGPGQVGIVFPHLKLLNVEGNNLSDWMDIMQFSQSPWLRSLFLADNGFENVSGLSTSSERMFPSLQLLSLRDNKIASWQSIAELNHLPSLQELRCTGNCLTSGETTFHARQLLIATLPDIKTLNNSPVTAHERVLAERYYVARFYPEFLRAGGSAETPSLPDESFRLQHTSFARLLKKHGVPETVVTKRSPAILKNSLLALTLQWPDDAGKKVLTKKLPDNMALLKLKGLIQRVYSLTGVSIVLSYICSQGGPEREMDDDLRELSYFAISSGDTVLIRLA